MPDDLAPLKDLASELHARAWGSPWPQEKRSLPTHTTVVVSESGDLDVDIDTDSTDVSTRAGSVDDQYDCLLGIGQLRDTFCPPCDIGDTLVILREYISLYDALTTSSLRKRRGIAVIGQPGIGKTTFLLYLLLRRLELKQPTAIQLGPWYYFIFDEVGADVILTSKVNLRLKKCWALADSNASVKEPCSMFQSYAEHVVQVTPPGQDRWKDWITQVRGRIVIMDLPTTDEIVAIIKEKGLDSSQCAAFVAKWGPCVRTIVNLMDAVEDDEVSGEERMLDCDAGNAACDICATPSRLLVLDSGIGNGALDGFRSTLLFVRPKRSLGDGAFSWGAWAITIPTEHLMHIFEQQRVAQSSQVSLDLFKLLSRHALTRQTADWNHEMMMHSRVCTTDNALFIFRGALGRFTGLVQTSKNLLPGSISGLAHVSASNAFYWMPLVADLNGIDGVLGTADGKIYALQATVAEEYKSPKDGLEKVWEGLRPEVRSERRWNLVLVADKPDTATCLLRSHSNGAGLKLGEEEVPVVVWSCYL